MYFWVLLLGFHEGFVCLFWARGYTLACYPVLERFVV